MLWRSWRSRFRQRRRHQPAVDADAVVTPSEPPDGSGHAMKSLMLFAALAFVCSLSLSVEAATASQQANSSLDGEQVFLNRCSTCHGTERALVASRTRRAWEGVLAEMVNNGAQLEAGELDAILAFLMEQRGLVNVNAAKA